ncbi:MAG: hypothetical protein MUE56_04370 [Ignavibacteria bacterium]|jgi:hypothetical protein|nr:hypothetical protein [Ignavibacteria bacterium]
MSGFLKILLLVLIFPCFVAAQKENYNATVDAKTYDYFVKSDWKNLRETGYSAIDAGIDFYYLRLRMGISYYNAENYMSAIPHFEKALHFRNKDTLALEYLYYSYLFSGLKSDASITAEKFPARLKEKIGYKSPDFVSGLYSEGGYTFVPGFNDIVNKNKTTPEEPELTYKVPENETYINLSLNHSFGSRVKYFHGLNSINVNSSIISNTISQTPEKVSQSTKQLEYYGRLSADPGKYFSLFASLHYLHISIEDPTPPPQDSPPPRHNTNTSTYNEFVYSAGTSKRVGNFEPGISLLYSNLSGGNQNQAAMTLAYYPLGNLNLYSVTGLILHSNRENQSSDYITNFIFDEKIGFKISDNFWAEGVVTAGSMVNYSENNGFIVYNVTDKMNYKFGGNLLIYLSENFELSFRYLVISTEYKVYSLNNPEVNLYETEKLYKHKIIGGLKWTF